MLGFVWSECVLFWILCCVEIDWYRLVESLEIEGVCIVFDDFFYWFGCFIVCVFVDFGFVKFGIVVEDDCRFIYYVFFKELV